MQNKWIEFSIVNFITLLRVIGVFLLIPVFKIYGGVAAFWLSAICFFSDLLDGFLARKLDCATFFGGMFDALSDKAFLIVNMVLLMSITPIAILLIILELSIAWVQTVKYQKSISVQSSKVGKAKMWVAGILISLCYLLVDQKEIINMSDLEQIKVFSTVLIPLVIIELITLINYIKEYIIKKKALTKSEIAKKEQAKIKMALEMQKVEFKDLLFNPKYYKKYKDCNNLDLVKNLVSFRKKG